MPDRPPQGKRVVIDTSCYIPLEGKGLSRFFNNVLIALSARRIGAVVITSNRADFERIRACYGFELYLWE